jgi:hypothetical protein
MWTWVFEFFTGVILGAGITRMSYKQGFRHGYRRGFNDGALRVGMQIQSFDPRFQIEMDPDRSNYDDDA